MKLFFYKLLPSTIYNVFEYSGIQYIKISFSSRLVLPPYR